MPETVVLLTTGGTVSTTTTAEARSAPTLGTGSLTALAQVADIILEPREFSKVPSWALDPSAMADLARTARDAAREPGIAGVVVSHGTTTLEYSAFLTDLVLDAAAPVVFTGAMRRADADEPDGPANLRDAVTVAAHPATRDFGGLVVFAGRVIAARRAWKARRVEADAFVGLDGDLGRVVDGVVDIRRRPSRAAVVSGRLEPNVALVKVVPGADGRSFASVDRDVRGLVIEGLPGVGGIPPGAVDAVRDAAARMPVVLASRSPYGRLPAIPTGGTGEPLSAIELLSAGDLTAEQAWLLLMATLGDGGTAAEIARRFAAAATIDD